MNQCPICGGVLQAGYLHFNCMLLAFHPDKDFPIYYFFPTKKRLKKQNPEVVLLHGPYSFGIRGSKPVSYTHLDVYKRQLLLWAEG